MSWKNLTRREQAHCRKLHDQLTAVGCEDATVSQVAAHYEDVQVWGDGGMTLAELCAQTGWTPPANTDDQDAAAATATPIDAVAEAAAQIKKRAARIAKLRDELKGELRDMRAELNAGKAAGIGANELVRLADGGLSKAAVFQHLKVVDIEATVRAVIKEFEEEWGVGVLATLTPRPGDAAVDLSLMWEDNLGEDYEEYDEVTSEDAEDRRRADDTAHRNWVSGFASELRERGLHLCLADDPFGDVVKAMATEYATGRITKLREEA